MRLQLKKQPQKTLYHLKIQLRNLVKKWHHLLGCIKIFIFLSLHSLHPLQNHKSLSNFNDFSISRKFFRAQGMLLCCGNALTRRWQNCRKIREDEPAPVEGFSDQNHYSSPNRQAEVIHLLLYVIGIDRRTGSFIRMTPQ